MSVTSYLCQQLCYNHKQSREGTDTLLAVSSMSIAKVPKLGMEISCATSMLNAGLPSVRTWQGMKQRLPRVADDLCCL